MAKKLGTIKSISGSAEVIAVDKSGNQRVLKVGDSLYEGETVKTTSADSKVVIATNNGKELSMIGEDTLNLDPKATAADSQVAALQKALLNGANLEDLEETAAGGNSGGRGDGMSLGETRFEHGGHYSNISASTSAINPLGAASFAGPVEGKSGGLDSGRGGDDGFYIDTTPPRVIIDGITPVDTNSPADGNPDKATVTGKSDEPNAPVIVKDKDGNVIGEGKTDNDGKFVIDTTKPVKPGDKVTVEVTDNAGNTGKGEGTAGDTIYTDTTAPSEPTITFVEDLKPKDGKLNKAENSSDGDNANTTAKISIPADAVVGDVIKYTVNGGTEQSHPITDADKAAGHVEIKVPVTDGQTSSVTAKIVDQAGNVGKEAKESLDVDTKAPSVENVKVTPVDTNSPADGNPDKATVTGKSDEPNAPVIVKDKDGNVIGEGKTDNDGKFVIDTTKPVKPGDKVTVEVTDNAGNTGKGEGTAGDTIYTDTTAPSEPTITFVEDLKPKDGKLNKAENSSDGDNANTTAKISIPADAVVGDVIKYTVNGGTEQSHPITDADKAAGHVEIKVPVTDGQTSSVTAKIVDQAGNVGKEAKESLDVDTKAPSVENVKVTPVDTNSPADGNPDKATVTGKSDEPNAPVIVKDKDGNVIGEGKTDNDGKFVIDTTKPVKPGDKVTVEVTDNAGNTGKGEGTAGDTIYTDTTAPSEPTITFVEDLKPKDGKLNKAENSSDGDNANTTAKISIPADAVVGDVIKYTVNGGTEQSHPITDADKAAGHVEIKVPVTDGQTSSVTAKIVDQAGNVGKEAKESLDVDTKAPSVENVKVTPVDTNSPADGNPDKATVTGKSDEPNAPVIVKDKDGNVIGEGKTDNDGKFVIDTTKPVKPGDKVTVEVTDNAGNTGKGEGTAGDTIYTDTTAPSEPTITFVEDLKPKDGKLNKAENSSDGDNANTTAKISIPADAVVGDVIKYTVNGGTEQSHPITDADKAAGHVEIKVPVTDGQTSSVTAKIVDQAGNVGKEAKESLDVDTKAPSVENVKVTPVDTNSPADGNPDKATVTGKSDEPNAPVIVKDKDGNVIGEGKTDNDGKFVIDTTKPVKPGDKVTVEVTDNAGNTGKGEGTAGDTIYTDTTAPSEPTITFVEDLKPKDGKLNKAENSSDGDNANTTAKISIPADAVVGDVIKYTVNGGTEQSHPITDADKAAGHVEIKVPVTDGQTSSVTAKIVDQAGNVGKEAKESLDVDTKAPSVENVKVTPVDTNSPADGNPDKATVTGKSDEPNAPVIVKDKDGNVIGEGKTDNDGKFVIDTTKPVKPGDKVTVEVTDNAGNTGKGEGTAGDTIYTDTTAPSEPTITFVEDLKPKDGKLNKAENSSDGDNANTTAKISIPADAVVGDVIKYTVNGGTEQSHPITDADKAAGHVEIKVPVTDGQTSSVTAKIVDQAGNVGKEAKESLDVDTKAPSVENVKVTPVDTNSPADGNPDKATVTGKSDEPNAPVIVKDKDGNVIGEGKTDNDGKFVIDTTKPVKPGDKVTVEVTDNAGNTGKGEGTAGDTIYTDTTAPSEPTITFVEDLKPKDGKLNKAENSSDGDNANTTAKISIPADAVVGDVIKYTVNGGTEQSHPITDADKAAGHVEIKVPVTDGQTSSVTAKIVDQAGNVGKEAKESLDVDTKAPSVENVKVTPVDTNSPADGNPDKATVTGKSDEPNAPVIVKDKDGNVIGEGKTDNDGKFVIDTTKPVKPGDKVTVEVTDNAGNTGKGEGTAGDMDFNDNVAPDAPVITEVTDNAYGGIENGGNVLGINDGFTNDNTPTFKGTAEPNTTIVLKNGNDVIGKDIIVKADGSWEFTPKTPLADGEYNVVAIATDKAGNVSVPSNVATINIDTHVTTPVITEIIDDVAGGIVNGDVKNGLTNDNTPTLKGTAEPGSTVKVWIDGLSKGSLVNGEVIYDWTTITKEDGTWEFTTPKLSDGSHTFKVQTTDRAGNNSPESSVVSVNIDTTIGNPKVRFVEDTDGNGVLSVAEVAAIKDGKAHWVIDIPTDGSVKAGDVIQSIDGKGNWVKFVEITDEMIKDGKFEATFNVDINKLKDGKYETPEYRFADEAGNVSESSKASLTLDSEFSRQPSNPSIKFPEDTNEDGKISDKENKAGDNDAGKTTAEVVIPKDGSVKPGDKLVVTDENGKQTEKTIEQGDIDNGNIKVPVDLNPGKDNTITAEIINPNNPNNPGKGKGVIGEDSENTKAPEAPVITEVIDDVKGGKFNEDVKGGLTNDSTPTIKGTAKAGSKVEIYDDGNKIGETIAKPNGSWEFTTPELTKQGEHKFTATAENTFGKSALSNEVTIDLDTIAPVIKEVTITPIDTSAKADDTAEATLIVGVTDTPHATVIAKDKDGNFLGRADANDKGGFVIDAKPVNPGDKVIFEVTDKAGNTSESEFKAGDLTHPNDHTAPKVDIDTVTPVDETNPSDGTPDKGIVKGKSDEPNAPVVVTDENGKTIGTGTTDDKGNFDITTSPIKPGDKVTVEVTDKAGNKGKDTETAGDMDIIHKDLPETPVITDVIDDVKGYGEDTKVGNVLDVEGHLTNDKTPTIKGTAKAGSTVVIYDNGVEIGKIERADANWEFTTPVLTKQGEHKFTAIAENKFGKSTPSNEVTIDLDSIAPKLDSVKITPIDTNSKADDTAELTMGTGHTDTPNAEILFRDENNNIIGKGHANSAGDFAIQLDKAVQPGTPVFVQAIDKAGNAGTDMAIAGNIEHPNDHTAPSEPTITFVEDVNPKDGKLNKAENSKDGDSTSTKAQISVPGDAEENDVIHYTINGEEKTHTITYNDRVTGYVEIKVPVVDGKASSVTAKIVDQAGNASKEVSGSVDVDIHIDAPVITAVTDNWWGGVENGGNILGVNDGFTNDTTPTFKGTAEAGSTIVLKNGNDIINKDIIVKADADGNWEFTPKSPLAEGEYNVVAIATDKAGNVSNPSNVATVNVDISTTQPVITEIIDDVVGGVVGNVKNALTNDNLPTLKGTAEAFSTVKIMVDDKLVFKDGKEVTATADKDGNWEYTFEANLNWDGKVHAALEDGVHTLKVQTTDRAGNRSAVSEWSSVDVDTTIGAPTVKITTDINSDKKIDIADASALKDGKLKWVIDIPENTVKAGDRVQILGSDAKTWTDIFKVTAQDIAKGFIERDEFSIDMPKSRGFQTPSYRLVDDAGNVSEGSMDAVKIVGFAPKAPTIIAVLDNEYGIDPKNPTDINAGDTTGNVLEGTIAITNDKTPTLIGKAEAGTTITLKNGDTVIAEKIPVDANGNWHYEPEENSPWADGDYKITAIAKNVFGKESESSSPITVTVDTTGPEVTLTSIEDSVKTNDVVDFTGNVKDKFTNDNTPLLKGTAEAGSVIIIKYGEHHENVVTTKADKNGHWDYKITNPLSDGEHIISYQAVDKAGNTSPECVANVTVDTKIVDLRIDYLGDKNHDGKYSWSDNISNENNVIYCCARFSKEAVDQGLIKVGDKLYYEVHSNVGAWNKGVVKEPITITELDLKRGYVDLTSVANITYPSKELIPFGKTANGFNLSAKAYLVDEAGNMGKQASEDLVFDFSDKPADPVKNIKINAEAIYGDNNTGLLLEGHGPVLKASTELQPQLNGNDNYEIDVKTITHKAEFTLGSGDDVVNIHKSGNGWGWINMDSKIDLGDGNNRLIVAADLDSSTVISGKGDDYIEIKDDVANGAKIITGAGNDTVIVGDTVANTIFTKVGISTGDGNDSVTIKGDAIDKAKIDLGNGDDTLTIKAAHVIGGVDDKGALDGGKGYDKLIISSPEDTIDLKHVSYHAKNFEELDISGDKNTTLKVGIEDVLDMTDDKHTLKITGDKGDTVDLKEDVKGSGWHQGASEDGYTTYTNNTVTIQIKDEIHVI